MVEQSPLSEETDREVSTNMADVTARYVDVRLDRKRTVLETYHNAMFPREAERIAAKKMTERTYDER